MPQPLTEARYVPVTDLSPFPGNPRRGSLEAIKESLTKKSPETGISPKTVEAHVSAVLRKLQLSSRHELSRWAVERRLVD
jgi:hypothetical protein